MLLFLSNYRLTTTKRNTQVPITFVPIVTNRETLLNLLYELSPNYGDFEFFLTISAITNKLSPVVQQDLFSMKTLSRMTDY